MPELTRERIPRHVAIIMDGNGRWAQKRGLPRVEGHKRGVEVLRKILEKAYGLGIEILTFYAFSTENWKRPREEIRVLMDLLCRYLEEEVHTLVEKDIRLMAIGQLERLPRRAQKLLSEAIRATARGRKMVLVFALSYSGRLEIVEAARSLGREIESGRLLGERINPRVFAKHLYTRGLPDPELLIRTSGEYRISNFLLWQMAYTEIYVSRKLWPDFTWRDFLRALKSYGRRERRFGSVKPYVSIL